MASAPPQLPPASSLSSLDPNLKSSPRFKNNWSQIVRGDADPPHSHEKQQQQQQHQLHHHPKTSRDHPQRQSQQQPPQRQQQQLLLPSESTIEGVALVPTSLAATESASGIVVSSSDSPSTGFPAACSSVASEKMRVGDSPPEDSESVIDKPDRSEVDASIGEGAAVKGGAPETAKVAKPAWRMPPANAGKNSEPGLVMGAVSWPALGDARSAKSSEPPFPTSASAAGQRAGLKPASASVGREGSTAQASVSEPSIHLGASGNGSDSSTGIRQKSSLKRGVAGNGMPPYWEPVPPEKVSTPVMGHFAPGADIVSSNQFVKGSGELGTKAVLANAGTGDQARMYHQRGEGGVSFPNFAGNRRHNMRDQGRGNQGWQSHNRSYMNGRDYGLALQQQRIGPRNLPRPTHPFMSASPGFINTAGFPNAGGMYYMPAPVPDPLLGAAYFAPPASPGVLMHGPDPMTLRAMLVKQIEYYFSVENLCRDVYLRSNMDKQGFVPISVIANFNRVRMLTLNPHLILDSLRKSMVVEVQGERIRKRDDWAKWIIPPMQNDSTTSAQEHMKEKVLNTTAQEDRKGGAKSYIPVRKDEANKTRLDGVDDRHDIAVITSSLSLPRGVNHSERSDGSGAIQDSCMEQSYVMEVKGSDGDEHSCIPGRTPGSGDIFGMPSSHLCDAESSVRHGFVGDLGSCVSSDDARSVEGRNIGSHLRSVAEMRNTQKENLSASMDGITFPQVKEGKPECHLLRDHGCQPESSEDKKDLEVTEDGQRFNIVVPKV